MNEREQFAVGWMFGAASGLCVGALAMAILLILTSVLEADEVLPAPVADSPAPVRDPFVPSVSVDTLVRSDAHGVLGAGLAWGPERPYGTLTIGTNGEFDDHAPMAVFGRAGGRLDDVGLSALLAADWISGELSGWIAGARLSWWPDLLDAGHPVEVWAEYGADAFRFGMDAEGAADWFLVGGSVWIDTAKAAGLDLYIGAALDGLRLRIGGLYADAGVPAWWGRGRGDGDPSLYASIGWRG